MRKTTVVNRRLNILNLFVSTLIFGTGLILLTQFHIGDGALPKEWLGLGKDVWLIIHQVSAIGFLVGFVAHIQMHWKYIKIVVKRWRKNLPKKIKTTMREQVLLLIATLVVLWAGFYPWIAMPGSTLENETFHHWIDIHNRVGIFYLIGLVVHILRRWRRVIRFTRKRNASEPIVFQTPVDRKQKYIIKENIMRSKRNRTKYIRVDSRKCKACWECIDECKYDTLGKVDLWFHKHVVIKNAEKCSGCKLCIAVCPNGVFEPVIQTRTAMNQ
jgi:2-oxoglutarate ferredoxin oxidoreductase subunit delta